jgi:small subunit ribosomal protein S4
MNYNGPKVKLSRKLGLELTPKAHKITSKKPYPPGQHGASKRRGKQSDYGKQLMEKQRLRLQFNVSESQMRNYYKKATRMTGNTADILVQLLETRLDSVVMRSGLARTIYASRQYVNHGHVLVNGRKVDVASYQVKPGDIVAIKEKSRKMDVFQDAVRNSAAPEYLEMNKAEFSAKLINVPAREDIPVICEVALVVEYYSR